MSQLEKGVSSCVSQLRDITLEVNREKETKEKEEVDFIKANSHIQTLEEELQNTIAKRVLQGNRVLEQEIKLKASKESCYRRGKINDAKLKEI